MLRGLQHMAYEEELLALSEDGCDTCLLHQEASSLSLLSSFHELLMMTEPLLAVSASSITTPEQIWVFSSILFFPPQSCEDLS